MIELKYFELSDFKHLITWIDSQFTGRFNFIQTAKGSLTNAQTVTKTRAFI